MSIEKDLSRIADALETLVQQKGTSISVSMPTASLSGSKTATVTAPVTRTPKVQPPPVNKPAADVIPPPVAPPATATPTTALPTTFQELQKLAGDLMNKFDNDSVKSNAFLTFVRDSINARFGVKRLSQVPVTNIPQVAKWMIAFVEADCNPGKDVTADVG